MNLVNLINSNSILNKTTILLLIAIIVAIYLFYTIESEKYTNMINANLPGFDFPNMPLRNYTEDSCEAACKKDPNCMWFNYETGNKNCWLKKGSPNPSIITGVNARRSDPIIVGVGLDIPGFDMPNMPIRGTESEATCANLCQKADCSFWNYNKQNKDCWLKKTQQSSGVITGFNVPDIKSPKCPEAQTCPTCPPQQQCPTCPTCPPQQQCPTCPLQQQCPACTSSMIDSEELLSMCILPKYHIHDQRCGTIAPHGASTDAPHSASTEAPHNTSTEASIGAPIP
jgi:hypothetical protein